MTDEEIVRQAMSILGRRKSERKTAAGRASLARARGVKPLKPCNCGRSPHKSTCPVYQREAQKKSRKKFEKS